MHKLTILPLFPSLPPLPLLQTAVRRKTVVDHARSRARTEHDYWLSRAGEFQGTKYKDYKLRERLGVSTDARKKFYGTTAAVYSGEMRDWNCVVKVSDN